MATQTQTREKLTADKSQPVPVTVDNFKRAESNMYFRITSINEGAFGKFFHKPDLFPVDNQTVVRGNRDTIYSSAVFDLDAGPVTISLPDAGTRFMSMMVVNEDHYVLNVYYGKGDYEITREEAGTRYVLVGIRTLVDPDVPGDLDQVHTLQQAVKVKQPGGPGMFEVPNWDSESQKKIRDALIVLGSTIRDFKNAFGKKTEVDPVRHLIGSAIGWGGNPDKEATYLNVTPPQNDGKKLYRLTIKEVPVDAFWSVSVYNANGYFEKNDRNAYTINNLTAKKESDDSIIIQFGGCDNSSGNCIPITEGWNYTVRLYRPRLEILNGKWKFPEPEAIS